MDSVHIRKATLSDLETLLRFEQGIMEVERPFDVTLRSGGALYYDLETMLRADNVALVVAQIADQPVGCGYARIENSKPYLQHSQHAYLGFMYVLPEHRGKGINKAIIDALKTWASSKSITELRLEVYGDNIAAIKAYEKAGFKKLMVEMRMSVR